MTETAEATMGAPAGSVWWIELARRLGETMGRASATVGPRHSTGTRRSTEALLRELGQIVNEHQEQGYDALESEPRFWALVSLLHTRHREIRYRRAAPNATAETKKPTPGAEPVDAKVSAAPVAESTAATHTDEADKETDPETDKEADEKKKKGEKN